MQITVNGKLANLNLPVRGGLQQLNMSTVKVLEAVNSHIGRLKAEQTGEDKRTAGKVNVKKNTFKMNVTPGKVSFTGTADTVGLFIAWHDAITKAYEVCMFETVEIPVAFRQWLQFAVNKEAEQVPA